MRRIKWLLGWVVVCFVVFGVASDTASAAGEGRGVWVGDEYIDNFCILPRNGIGIKVGETAEVSVVNIPAGYDESDLEWYYDENHVTFDGKKLTGVAPGVTELSVEVKDENTTIESDYITVAVYTLSGSCGTDEVQSDLVWKMDSDAGVLTIGGQGDMPDYISAYSDEGYEYNSAPWYPTFLALRLNNDFPADGVDVVVEEGVTSVGECAFFSEFGTLSVNTLLLPDSIARLGNYLGYFTLASSFLPENLEIVENGAFYFSGACFPDQRVYFPDGIKSLGDYSFYVWGGDNLTEAYFCGDAPTEFGENVFPDSDSFVIYYIPGTTGWTDSSYYDADAGTWNGYTLRTWDGPQETVVLQLLSRSPEVGGTASGSGLTISMTFNCEIESVQTGISFDENNNTVIHGNFRIARQIEEADGWQFETVYSLSEGDHADTDVTVNGSTVTIDVSSAEWILGETYYVLMDPGVITFKNTDAQIGFAGTEWTFTVFGAKTGTFRYKAQYGETRYPYTYDDSWFQRSSTEYNHDLARMSLRAAIAAYGTGSNADGSEYIRELMTDELGFHDLEVYYPTPMRNSIGYAIGSKTIPAADDESGERSLILIAIRGGAYGIEWGGNFTVGDGEFSDGIAGDLHEGFLRAAEQVEDGLASYIRSNRQEGKLKENCVVWIVGYSRAAATANLLAKNLDDGSINGLGTENVFAYCFECPQNSRADDLTAAKYNNIISVVNPLDLVTMVAMSDWGYGRYGQTFWLPYEEGVADYSTLKYQMIQQYIQIIQAGTTGGDAFAATEQITGQRDMTEGAANWLADTFHAPAIYTTLYQEALTEVVEAFMKNDWGGLSTNFSVLVVLGKLGLIADDAIALPDTPLELALKVYNAKDNINALMALELFLCGLIERGDVEKTAITYTHYPELCLAWMDSLSGDQIARIDSKYRRVLVNCPVDVSVYDDENVLVGQVIGKTVQNIENGVSVYMDTDDQIVISLPDTEEYRIVMNATDDGTVTYTVTEHDIGTGGAQRVVSYPLIGVTLNDQLAGSIESLAEQKDVKYDLTVNGAEQTAAVDQSGKEIASYLVSYTVEGDGTVTGGRSSVYGEYQKLVASPEPGAEFLGWYNGDTLLTAEMEYRFCVTGDVSLTAKFTNAPQNPEQCTFALNGSSTAASAVVRISNEAETALKGIFVVAAYDADGQLVGMKMASGKLYPNEPVSLTVTSGGNDIAFVKGFILDQDTKAPLAASWQQSLAS